MIGDVIRFFTGIIFGFWDILLWLVRTWCELIVSVLSLLGWLLVIGSVLVLTGGDFLAGAAAYAFALCLMAVGHAFRLLDFWLSEKSYTVHPEAFVGDVVGTVFGFIIIFGGLLALWYFVFPADLLIISTVALAPVSILDSLARFTKNFLATMKDKLKPKPKPAEKQAEGGASNAVSAAAASVAVEAAKQMLKK